MADQAEIVASNPNQFAALLNERAGAYGSRSKFAAAIGVNTETLQKLCTGENKQPKPVTLAAISKGLGISIVELFAALGYEVVP